VVILAGAVPEWANRADGYGDGDGDGSGRGAAEPS
jgi:hypothetical protein